ncbi:hypothetical protein Bca4012_083614 [Brassica carinata]|uniref:Uncharacterized protein n=1 Tax=Brassica carinata TaxID=52824 RepID=A0A8X7SJ98_BRACI|nr:hypothetical protein Bca52824_027111 [Brassica carinata]
MAVLLAVHLVKAGLPPKVGCGRKVNCLTDLRSDTPVFEMSREHRNVLFRLYLVGDGSLR